MKNRNGSVRSVQALAPAELLFLVGLLIPGSAALSQPFPSFMLDSTIVRGPSFGYVSYTSVASGPDVALVVWIEGSAGGTLLAARVSSDGTLLDTTPIDLRGPDAAGFVNMRPGVAWGGNRFLVVWTEVVDFVSHNYARCALVREDGTVAQRCLLQDSINDAQCVSAAAAFDGTNFLASWSCFTKHHYMQPGAYFARVSPEGVVIDNPPRLVAPLAPLDQGSVDVCFHGNKYLAVWNEWDTSGVWGNFILPDGSTPDSAGFPIRHGINSDCPSVTHDRHNYIVAWHESSNKTMLARVSDSGDVIDSAGMLIDSFSNWQSDVFSIGDTTLVAYISDSIGHHDSLTLLAVRVDTALRQLDSAPVAVSWTETGNTGGGGPGAPALALCGSGYLAAWFQPCRLDGRRNNASAFYRRLTPDGQLVDSTQIAASYGANRQIFPAVASDGTDFLAAWVDTRRDSAGEHWSRRAARFTADGAVLDPKAIPIPGSGGSHTVMAFGGGCYMVAWWGAGNHALAVRIGSDGVLMDTVPILLSGVDELDHGLAVSAGDSTFLVAWSTSGMNIHGVRVTPTGVVLDSTPLLLQKNTSNYSLYPQVAFDGENFLVARNDAPTASDDAAGPRGGDAVSAYAEHHPAWYGFSAVRINEEGQIIDSSDIKIAKASAWYEVPQLAYGDGVYLVKNDRRYVSWRVSTNGEVLDSVSHPNSGSAQVCFDGTNFLLLCQGDTTLAGMRISPEGVLLDSTPSLLVNTRRTGEYTQCAPLVANDAGRIGLVFQDFEPSPWLNHRVRASTFPSLGVGSQREVGQPVAFRVQPNPASRLASLTFNLTQAGPVQVTAFDVAGRRCASLFSGRLKAGRQTLPLDTRRLANGVYFLRLEAGTTRHSTRLVVSR